LVLLAIFFHPRAKYSVWTVLLGIWPFFPWTLASIVTWINMMHPVARLYLQKTGIDELGSRTSMLFFGVLYLVILWKSTKSRWIALSYVIVLVSSDLMWIVQYDLQWRTSPIIRSVCVYILWWKHGLIWYSIFAVVLLQWFREGRAAINDPSCWHCSYDLTGHTPEKPCPECGHKLPDEHPLWYPSAHGNHSLSAR